MMGRLLSGLVVLALAPALGLATLAGMATFGAGPDVFAVAGLAVFASVFFLGLLLCVPRPPAVWGRRLRALGLLAVEVLVVWQVSTALLGPPPDASAALPAVAGQRQWELPTGSRLAYVRSAPGKVTKQAPVVFLHGGPGLADLKGDSAFFGKLAADGYAVYTYDQLGAGRSARLPDPGGYGLRRDVMDLEAIREAVGAERLILIGHGAGAQLGAAYLAAHPDRVEKAVYSSPASLSPATAALGLSAHPALPLPEPRALAVQTLLRVAPGAAHAFAGDREMDARLDREYRLNAATLHCPGVTAGAESRRAGGYTSLSPRAPDPGTRQALAGSRMPSLVIKGSCDRQPWSSALEYPRGDLVYLEGAGHHAYQDRPGPYLKVVRAFLAGEKVPSLTGDQPPPGYHGGTE